MTIGVWLWFSIRSTLYIFFPNILIFIYLFIYVVMYILFIIIYYSYLGSRLFLTNTELSSRENLTIGSSQQCSVVVPRKPISTAYKDQLS
jgi:hypothetical protein